MVFAILPWPKFEGWTRLSSGQITIYPADFKVSFRILEVERTIHWRVTYPIHPLNISLKYGTSIFQRKLSDDLLSSFSTPLFLFYKYIL